MDNVPDTLPQDLRLIVDRWDRQLDVCRMLCLDDLRASLPRPLSRAEAQALVAALVGSGIHLADAEPAERLLASRPSRRP